MYSFRPNLVIGFHGCTKDVGLKAINGEDDLVKSQNKYDWLGSGVYFWENDYERALEFANENGKNPPFVIGAVLYLGHCLDLTQRKSALIIKNAYENLIDDTIRLGTTNKPGRQGGINGDLPLRYLDCAVIESIHDFNHQNGFKEYDSVKAAFWEGNELYHTAGFREKNHIQICVRNSQCILGYFLPRQSRL